MDPILLGLLTGAAFGAVLVLSGLSDPDRIWGMLRLRELWLLQVLTTALAVGIAGMGILFSTGLIGLEIKTLHALAIAAGGLIFGAGFALTGYCPGSALAGFAQGRLDAGFSILGGLVGALLFAFTYDALEPVLIAPLTYGKPTLPEWLGLPHLAVALSVSAVLHVILVGWHVGTRRSRPVPPPTPTPKRPRTRSGSPASESQSQSAPV